MQAGSQRSGWYNEPKDTTYGKSNKKQKWHSTAYCVRDMQIAPKVVALNKERRNLLTHEQQMLFMQQAPTVEEQDQAYHGTY